MDDLIAFLKARFYEREATIKAWPQWYYTETAFGVADVAAKRQIIDEFEAATAFSLLPDTPGGGYASALAEVVRLLALPFASHPDFREEWRP